MKKLLFLFYMLLSFDSIVQAQPVSLKSYKADYAKMENGEWVFSKPSFSDITIYLSSNMISLDNRSKSSFYIVENLGKYEDRLDNEPYWKFVSYMFKARDNKNRNCEVYFIDFEKVGTDILFSVVYEDVWFRYYIKNSESGLDKFLQ